MSAPPEAAVARLERADVAKKGGSGRGGRGRSPGSGSRTGLYALLAAVVVVALFVYLGPRGDDGSGPADRTCTPVSGFSDLHGLAVSPEDPSLLYAATHHGLMRATNDTSWCRVGSSQDDYMGFSMHPTNASTFWVSGHPRFGGNMGVRQSTDGGYTWETLALEGVDFHAMTVSPADPDRLWGSFRGKIHRSDDGGHGWDIIGDNPEAVRALVGHPADPDTVFAVGIARVLRSTDAGASWQSFRDEPASALGIDPRDPNVIYLAAGSSLARSTDGGGTWEPLPLQTDDETIGYLATSAARPGLLYAGTYQTGIHRSTDGGATWERVK